MEPPRRREDFSWIEFRLSCDRIFNGQLRLEKLSMVGVPMGIHTVVHSGRSERWPQGLMGPRLIRPCVAVLKAERAPGLTHLEMVDCGKLLHSMTDITTLPPLRRFRLASTAGKPNMRPADVTRLLTECPLEALNLGDFDLLGAGRSLMYLQITGKQTFLSVCAMTVRGGR
jgi:hypothetical protein